MGRDRKHKPFALGDEGYDAARQQATRFFRSSSTAQPAVRGAAGGGSNSEQDIAAAKAARDKMHTTKLSPKVHDQMKAQLDVEARKQAALQWFYRQFRIRGGKGWGLGSKAGRPSTADKFLTARAVKLSEGYAGDSGECRNMTPHEWWAQSAEAKKLYEKEGWTTEHEPNGEDLWNDSSRSQDCWVEELGDGQKVVKYFTNSLVKELLRSCWYKWSPSGEFIGLRTVADWRLACMSKFDANGKGSLPGKSQAFKWRQEEVERVKRKESNTEVPGSTLDFQETRRDCNAPTD